MCWLKVRRDYLIVLFLYKIIKGFTFSPLTLGQLNIHVPVFNTRKTCTFYYDTPHTSHLLHSPLFSMCNCYNRFQEIIPSLDIFNDSLQSFKIKIQSAISHTT
ncbi:unnamed protein product [Tenebrio molitor]|jgi:hypothetical protein|nr:unnamed protein product [Tenebrio molitor]